MLELELSDERLMNGIRAKQLACWQEGHRRLLETFLTDNSEAAREPEVLLDLIYAEVLLREEFGEHPEVEEYVRRFPTCEEAIRRQFAFHDALAALETGNSPTGASVATEVEATLSPSSPHRIETIISVGPYQVLGEIGRGGMGVVYEARHEKLNRVVALKMILAGSYAAKDDLHRFRTEAQAVARLQHPNIVQVYEIGEHERKPFFSLEYCSGGSLDRKLNRTPMPPKEAAQLVQTLARAMQAAHAANVIHRDLKPANVLLGADGTPKITDFGLAKKLDDVGQTQTGAIMGTPSYMAPEQAEGKSVGPLADVYALGAILYDCLTGRPPFKAATSYDTILQVVSEEPVPPRQLNGNVPKDLQTICLKCLHKAPEARYASAAELADDLRRYQQGEPILARPAGLAERAVKCVRRRPAAALLAGVGGLALVALIGGWIFFTLRLDEEKRQAVEQRDEAIRQKKRAEKEQKIALAERTKAQNQSKRASHLLELTAKAADEIAVNARSGKIEEKQSRNNGLVLFKLACYYAKAAKTLSKDAVLPVEDGKRLAEQYAVSAVRLLNCAASAGFFDKDRPANRLALKQNADLAILRARQDYKEFATGLP
jgi:serine/threonine-protein kinase